MCILIPLNTNKSNGSLSTCNIESEFSLNSIGKQLNLKTDADGYIYDIDRGDIYFMQDDTLIGVHVPENMNNYDTLRSLCQMEKIVIDSAV